MLNKLLKRCMPWMDKGRWVQIRVVGTDPTNLTTIYNDKEIVSAGVGVSGDNPAMTIVFKHPPHIIDCKFCPEVGFEFMILCTDLKLTYSTDNSFKTPVMGPGTYWFFMLGGAVNMR